jgi:fructose-bisphosphate aldolase, class I
MERMPVKARWNRLFATDGKCFEIAMDHGVHNEGAFLAGIENLPGKVAALANTGADAILLAPGQARWLQEINRSQKPALTLRVDPTNLYGIPTPSAVFCRLIDAAVEQALRLDAAAIVVNLLWSADQPELHRECLGNIVRLKPECDRFAMPLMIEPLAMRLDSQGGYRPHDDIQRSISLVRQAAELGADIIKADPPDRIDDFPLLLEAASGCPVLPRGGSRISDEEVLQRTYRLMQLGAAGIVYGRNIFQHPRPERMADACRAIVHQGKTVAQARSILEEGIGEL